MNCVFCGALISQHEVDAAIEIRGPGFNSCTGCARQDLADEERKEQKIVVLASLPDKIQQEPLPARFKLTEPNGTEKYVLGCGLCGRHCIVSQKDYRDEIDPICNDCSFHFAEETK